MIKFKTLEIEGFKSIGKLTYKLDTPGVSIISGANGVGKTTIIDALIWAIKGKTIKKVINPEPWEAYKAPDYKGTHVRLTFEVNNKEYQIDRYANYKTLPDGHGKNNLVVTGGEKIRDKNSIQAYIDTLIPISFDLLKNSIVFGQKLKRLLEVEGPQRKQLIEEIFDITYLEKAKDIAKEKLLKARGEYQDAKAELTMTENRLENVRDQIEQIEIMVTTWKTSSRRIITSLRKEIMEQKGIIITSTNSLIAINQIDDVDKTMEEIRARIKKAEGDIVKYTMISGNLKSVKADIERKKLLLKKMESTKPIDCPTCNQLITKETNTFLKKRLMKEIPELHKSYRRTLRINRKKINSYSDIVHDGYAKLQVYRDYHTKKVYHEEAKARAVAAVKRFKDEITQLKKTKPDITKLIGLKKELKELLNILPEKRAMVEKKQRKIESYEWVIQKPLASTGIKNYIINSLIRHINIRLNFYTKNLPMQIKLAVDIESASKNIYGIITMGKEQVLYQELSGGEEQLIDIITAFAIHDVITESRGVNILCLDEVFESLDSDNVAMVAELVLQKSLTHSIHLITHRKEFSLPNSTIINLTKVLGVSSLS